MNKLRFLTQAKTSLLAFEAAARHLSFMKAAQELNVTQPAISRSIARLEGHLGTRLFVRSVRGNSLSADGAILFQAVTSSYRQLEDVLVRISTKRSSEEAVTFSVSTAMVNLWFMPRMEALQRQFPGVDFRFQMISGEPHGPIGDVDLGVRMERFADAGDRLMVLAPEVILAVSSRDYRSNHDLEAFRRNASGLTFLSYNEPRLSWDDFLGQGLFKSMTAVKSMTFSDYAVILQAAMAGKGIALGWAHLIAHPLKEGMLAICGGRALRTDENYMLATQRGASRKLVSDIKDWMLAEMQQDRQALAELHPALAV